MFISQLQKFSNVSQYSPILKKTINGEVKLFETDEKNETEDDFWA